MKAFIVRIEGHPYSEKSARRCLDSIQMTWSNLKPDFFRATIPKTFAEDSIQVFSEILPYTWPKEGEVVRVNDEEGKTYKKVGYSTDSIITIMSCAMSHARLWKKCGELKEPIMILEHDAVFTRRFDFEELEKRLFISGAISINDPRGATRKSREYWEYLQVGDAVKYVPFLDKEVCGNVSGMPGNSAYVITPDFADEVLEKMKEIGIWPNDAFLCRQLFPKKIFCYNKPFTVVNQKRSTSQGR